MKEYRYSHERSNQLARKISLTLPPIIMFLIWGAFLLIDIYKGETKSIELLFTYTIMFFALIIVWIIVYKRAPKFGSELIQQYYFRVSDQGIEKIGPKGKMQGFNFSQITSFRFNKRGLLLESSKKKLLLPNGLEDFEELCHLIAEKVNLKD